MTSVIERAAKAVADYTGQRMPPAGDIVTCEGIVRAVLQAIREPTPEMCEAARKAHYLFGIDRAEDDAIGWTFEAMIDTALTE